MVQLPYPYMTNGKTIALTTLTFVDKITSLLFNMLSRLVMTFPPRSQHLLISWHTHTSVYKMINKDPLFCCCSLTQLCPALCDPMDGSMPGFPVPHHLPEFAQIHVHWGGDAIQPSHPVSPPSPPALNLSQHQGFFQWVSSLHQVAKVLEFQLQHQSFQWLEGIKQLKCPRIWGMVNTWHIYIVGSFKPINWVARQIFNDHNDCGKCSWWNMKWWAGCTIVEFQ